MQVVKEKELFDIRVYVECVIQQGTYLGTKWYNTACYPTRECYYAQGHLICHRTGGITHVPMT